MDWGSIQLMLRDCENGRTKYDDAFTLQNITRMFGERTEYPAIKIILRPIYKELSRAVKDRKEIPDIISDDRFKEIVYLMQDLLKHYYWNKRFKD